MCFTYKFLFHRTPISFWRPNLNISISILTSEKFNIRFVSVIIFPWIAVWTGLLVEKWLRSTHVGYSGTFSRLKSKIMHRYEHMTFGHLHIFIVFIFQKLFWLFTTCIISWCRLKSKISDLSWPEATLFPPGVAIKMNWS